MKYELNSLRQNWGGSPFDLALVDLFRPYILRGETTNWHAVLSVIYVESYETAQSADGIVIRGVARFSGNIDPPSFDPSTGVFSMGAGNVEGHPRNQPDRRDPWLDITDTKVEFTMTVPRAAGRIISDGVGSIGGGNAGFQPIADVLTAWDMDPTDAPPSDYPGTGFTLDLVLSGIEFRPPFLSPARMENDGLLVPDTSRPDVVFHLPKIKIRISQGSDVNAAVDVSLVSLGVSGLDDSGDLAAAELITMEPAYAFVGTGRVVGFGFRSAFLDLSDGYTPPEVLDQFGFDASRTGLYLPEIRLFVAPSGAEDIAVNAGVENFLIGIGDSSGITGDFDLAVINQGDGDMLLSARFFDQDGRAIGITRETDTTATVRLPETTRMVVDVTGGRAPYSVNANFGGSDHAGVIHDISTPSTGELVITLTATDTSSGPNERSLTIRASRREPARVQPPPGTVPPLAAMLQTTSITLDGQPLDAPELRMVSDGSDHVIIAVATAAPEPNTNWEVDGTPEGTSVTVEVPLIGGDNKSLRAVLPGDVITQIDGYFKFDQPPVQNPNAYAVQSGNINATEANDSPTTFPWKSEKPFLDEHRAVLARINPKSFTITGTASYDGVPDDEQELYNYFLSQRRAAGLLALINSDPQLTGFSATLEPSDPLVNGQPPDAWVGVSPPPPGWRQNTPPREQWWRARITGFAVNLPDTVIEGTVSRPAAPAPPPVQPPTRDDPPNDPSPPDWFRSARLKVRIVRDQFVAVEVSGSVDFETALEERLSGGGGNLPIQGMGNNPSDGIVD